MQAEKKNAYLEIKQNEVANFATHYSGSAANKNAGFALVY